MSDVIIPPDDNPYSILNILAGASGKTGYQVYSDGTSWAEIEQNFKAIYGENCSLLKNTNGDVFAIVKQNGEFISTGAPVPANDPAAYYNSAYQIGTGSSYATSETGTQVAELMTGDVKDTAGTITQQGAALGAMTMQDAIMSGMAVFGGVAKGIDMYNKNPEFWTDISQALLPFAYDLSYKDSGNKLQDALNALIPTTVNSKGQTYLQSDFLQTLYNKLAASDIYSAKENSATDTSVTVGSTTAKIRLPFYFMNIGKNPTVLMTTKNGNIYDYHITGDADIMMTMTNDAGSLGLYSTKSFTIYSSFFGQTNTADHKGDYYTWTVDQSSSTNPIVSYSPAVTLSTWQYDTYWNALYIFNGASTESGGSTIDGLSEQSGATYPVSGKTIEETYPSWVLNALKTINPSSTPNSPTYNNWYPVKVNGSDTDTTNDQTEAQTGSNPSNTELPGTPTVPQQKILDAIKDLIKTLTGQDVPTDVTPPTTPTGSTPTPLPPVISASSAGLIAIYNPTLAEVQAFAGWLWSQDPLTQLSKLFQNPMDAIIGMHILYATPVDGAAANIKVGYLDSGVSAPTVANQYTEIDCGSVSLQEYFANSSDYNPYTRVHVYLPFIGIVEVNTDDVMNSTIGLKYKVDVLTGTCLAQLTISKNDLNAVLYTYSGNCAVQLPLSGGHYGTMIAGLIGAAASVVVGVSTGGLGAGAALGIAGTAAASAKANVSMSGNLSSNAGAMGVRIPYIIISRPIPYNAGQYNSYYGYPSNSVVMLGNVSGFTRIKNIFSDIANATDEEKAEITALLKEGVIL